jgi:hypothetical protein
MPLGSHILRKAAGDSQPYYPDVTWDGRLGLTPDGKPLGTHNRRQDTFGVELVTLQGHWGLTSDGRPLGAHIRRQGKESHWGLTSYGKPLGSHNRNILTSRGTATWDLHPTESYYGSRCRRQDQATPSGSVSARFGS